MDPAARAWWKKPLPSESFDGGLVGWGLALLDGNRRLLPLEPQTGCPQEPFCTEWTENGAKCRELVAPGAPEWDARFSCYADSRTLLFDQEQELLRLDLPDGADQALLTLHYRDARLRHRSWPARAVGADPTVILRFDPDPGFSLDVRLRLDTDANGEPADITIASCQPRGDAERIASRVVSPAFRYCAILAARQAGTGR